MGNTEENKIMKKQLTNFIWWLRFRQACYVVIRVIVALLLCALLALVFIVMSNEIEWNKINVFLNIYLNENSIRLLWVFVILGIVGLVWIVIRNFQQIKHYQSWIIRLKALKLKISIKEQDSDKKLCEEEIYKDLKEILQEL